jgi:AbrB family looped-hinge helix DNA binding protein
MPIMKMSAKGQVVLPAEFRKKHGIKPGTYVRLEREGDHIRLTVAGQSLVEATYGMLRDYGTESMTAELLRERALDNEREERKLERRLATTREPVAQRA